MDIHVCLKSLNWEGWVLTLHFYFQVWIFLLTVVKHIYLTISLLIKYYERRSTIVKREFCIWQIYVSNKRVHNPSSLGTLLPAVHWHYAIGVALRSQHWRNCDKAVWNIICLFSFHKQIQYLQPKASLLNTDVRGEKVRLHTKHFAYISLVHFPFALNVLNLQFHTDWTASTVFDRGTEVAKKFGFDKFCKNQWLYERRGPN